MNLTIYTRSTKLAQEIDDNRRFKVERIGQELWENIFKDHPEVDRAYIHANALSRRLLMQFEASREYLQLPIEFLFSEDPEDFVILRHPVTRFVLNASPHESALSPDVLALMPELRVLIIASNTPYPVIDAVDLEAEELYHYLNTQEYIPVQATYIPSEKATRKRIERELESKSYDIIHYAGHGTYDPDSPEECCLYFWEEEEKQGEIVAMKADQLKMSLDESPTRLVYLSCCSGAETACEDALLDDDFLGLADAVVQAGVPSVLGFRWPVSDKGAKEFALAFYRSLLGQGSPEIAVWQARRKLARDDRDALTWLSPILIHQQ